MRRAFDPPLAAGWYEFEAAFDPAGVVDCLVELRFSDGGRMAHRLPLAGRNHTRCLMRLPAGVEAVDFHLAGSGRLDAPSRLDIRASVGVQRGASLGRRVWRILRGDPARFLHRAARFALRLGGGDLLSVSLGAARPAAADAYPIWRRLFDEDPARDRALHEVRLGRLTARLRLSVIAPVDDAGQAARTAQDLRTQVYPDWQLILVAGEDDAAAIVEALSREGLADPRIEVRPCPACDLGERLNAGLSAATGVYLLALPSHVRLRAHALLEFALTLASRPEARLAYADEDMVCEAGTREGPRFKPAWSPEVAATHDYLGDPVLMHAGALRGIGGWRSGVSGETFYDAKLRMAEAAGDHAVVHLAKLLAHRERAAPGDVGARERVIADHLARRHLPARIVADARSPYPRILHAPSEPPLASILIPTRDHAFLLRRCVDTLRAVTRGAPYEIVVMDNGSVEPETLALFASWSDDPRITVLPCPGPFNYSALNNAAAREARGRVLVLLNDDIEVVDPGWLEEMVGLAANPGIGCVGAKLTYPDGTLQHGGVATGPGGGAVHGHKHAPRAIAGYLDRLVTVTNVSAVTAACLAVRRDVYDEVGGLDETEFRIGFNDVDFCLKVASAGYRNVWTPFAELVHHESVSRGKEVTLRKARRFAAEKAALRRRWGFRLLMDPYYSPHLSMDEEMYAPRTG